MRKWRVFILLAAGVCLGAGVVSAQDTPALGDVARQARLQKQKKDAVKEGVSKDPFVHDAAETATKASHVITNDDIPSHPTTATAKNGPQPPNVIAEPSAGVTGAAERWKSTIQTQKNAIASLQSQIDSLNDSVHYAPANCVENCVQWNERQKQKQDQVESMKSQLEQQQKRLDDLQEGARRQGFGSSVYDP